MTSKPDPQAVEARLWRTLQDARAGMLAANPPEHMQPMHAFPEPQERRIDFVCSEETDLVRGLDPAGTRAHYVVMAKDESLWASLRGKLRAARDQARIDRYWSLLVAAWRPGQDPTDPSIVLLTLEIEEADVWTHEAGPLRFALEIAKTTQTDAASEDAGARRKLEMRHD